MSRNMAFAVSAPAELAKKKKIISSAIKSNNKWQSKNRSSHGSSPIDRDAQNYPLEDPKILRFLKISTAGRSIRHLTAIYQLQSNLMAIAG